MTNLILIDYAQAGYAGTQTDSIWSSSNWLAEQAGKECRKVGLVPTEVKMSKGYSVRVNRDYIVKFNTKTLAFEGISRK